MTTLTTNTHKQTVYIVNDNNGKLHTVQYAPTMSYSGRRDSDQYSLMMGLYIDNISHELWLGDIVCHLNQPCAWGVNTVKDIPCKIVAKMSYDWDMDAPMGSRMSNAKKTSNFDTLHKAIRDKATK